MGSIRKRLSARKTEEPAADQEAAKTVQAEPETPPAETDQAAGSSEAPGTPPQSDGSD